MHDWRAHLEVARVGLCRGQRVVQRVAEVAQQQVHVGAVGVEHRVELGVAAEQVQGVGVLLDGLPQVELFLVLQPHLERVVALVLLAGWSRVCMSGARVCFIWEGRVGRQTCEGV